MNVVLLVIDALRADHLSSYGYTRPTSHHLDALARQGVRFTDFFAHNNTTSPSFTTMMTSRHPLNHGIVGHLGTRKLDPSVPMLAEVLRDHGYATAAVDNLHGWFERGFEVYKSFVYDQRATKPVSHGEELNGQILPLLKELKAGGRPFFLFAHYWDTHSPYLPPPPYDTLFLSEGSDGGAQQSVGEHESQATLEDIYRFAPLARFLKRWIGDAPDVAAVVASYDAEIAYVDYCVGQVLAELDRLDLSDDTIVVVTADHGESLGEHGIYFDHHGLYDPELHVPLIMRHPRLLPAGAVIPGLARHIDLAPTLLDLVGLAGAMPCEGISLRERIEGTSGPATEVLLACESSWQSKLTLRRPDWKLIQALLPDQYGTPELELYDIKSDPGEDHNCAELYPDIVRQLLSEMDGMVAQELALGGHAINPMVTEGTTLSSVFGTIEIEDDYSVRDAVIDLLEEQGRLKAIDDGVYTEEEEALIEERLNNLGYL